MDQTLAPAPPAGFQLESAQSAQPAPPPPPPPGFEPERGQVPPPPGFELEAAPPSAEKDNHPVAEQKPNVGPDAPPGYWDATGSAFMRGMTERAVAGVAGVQATLPAGMGGKTLEEQYQEGLLHPKTKDALDHLTEQPISEGWSDPKWWMAKIAHGAGGTVPGLGVAAVGALARIPAPVGFGAESAFATLVPAYQEARAKGLDPDAAVQRALIDSGIATAGAVAMGVAPSMSIFGKAVNPEVTEQVATMMKRPVLEMLAQLGVVQPGLGVAQGVATTLTHGEAPTADQVLTDYVTGAGMGAVIHPTMVAGSKIAERAKAAVVPTQPPATPEQIAESFRAQQRGIGAPAEQFEQPIYPTATRDEQVYYSAVRRSIEENLPDKEVNPQRAMNLISKGANVKKAEIEDLELPQYLANANGTVSKRDLLAYVEEKQVRLSEEVLRDAPADQMAAAEWLYDQNTDRYGGINRWPETAFRHYDNVVSEARAAVSEQRAPEFRAQVLPGEHSNYREFLLKTPEPVHDPAQVEEIARQTWDFNYKAKYGSWERAGEASRESMRDQARDQLNRSDPNTFTGSHWIDPNVFAHFRVTSRSDRDGRRLLHVEEIQSDLHQRGAREGYRAPGAPTIDSGTAERAVDAAHQKYKAEKQRMEAHGLKPEEDPYVMKLRKDWFDAGEVFSAVVREAGKVPNLPFKTDWQELAVKRIMRLAADEGFDGVSWANGEQVALRLATDQQVKGARTNYDQKITSLFKRWGEKLGGTMESTRFLPPEDYYSGLPPQIRARREALHQEMGIDQQKLGVNNWVRITPDVSTNIRKGFPLYEEDVSPSHPRKGTKTLSDNVRENKLPGRLAVAARKIDTIVKKLSNEMKISRGITINAEPLPTKWRGRLRDEFDPGTGNYIIDVNTSLIHSTEDLYAAMSHEFGHVVEHNHLLSASGKEQAPIFKAFDDFRKSLPPGDITVGDVRRLRDNAISQQTGARAEHNFYRLSELEPRSRAYLLHRSEWFAEQVAKWMQTDQRPLSIVEKFFKSLANKVRKIINTFSKFQGKALAEPDVAVRDWLNSKYDSLTPWTEPIQEKFEHGTRRQNQEALAKDGTPEVQAPPLQASTVGGRNIIDSLPPDGTAAGKAMAAHGDRMNSFYDLMLSLPQIQELNPHIRGLRLYTDIVKTMNLMKNQIMGAAEVRLRQWRNIKDPIQLKGLTDFIQDYAKGMFKLPHTEDGVFRRPNQEEYAALAKKHGLSEQSLKVFDGITKDFDSFLEDYRKLLVEDAMRIKDPTRRKVSIENVNTRIDNLLKRPFIPVTRFGKYMITVYDAKGNIRHNEQTNSLRRQKQIAEALEKHSDRLPGDLVHMGMVPKDATPFLGMPPGLIDLVSEKLNLSESQKGVLDQLRFDYAPAQSFKHQFRNLDLVPGYETDFARAYAHFFFHGANHMTRVKWVDALRDQVAAVGKERLTRENSNKLDKIVRFMQTHLQALVDPKPDFAALRGLAFHVFLGFSPSAAMVNLTQTPLMTYPHLAAAFGDFHAIRAIGKASLELNNYYKKGKLVEAGRDAVPGPQGAKARALAEAIKQGVISETQAHQLAAISEDRNLFRSFGTKAEQGWLKFQEASAWMFEITEQYNRRLAFRAAWDIAMRDPNHRYVQEAVRDSPLQYKDLMDKGWSHQEAVAFTAAKQAVEKTQFVYAPYARPKFMRGRAGAAFVFKLFTQNTLFNLMAHPSQLARWMVVMGAMGGLQGQLGFEDLSSLLKTVAFKLFGKDFDLGDEVRRAVTDMSNGTISPDLVMHGLSARGFGIPQVMNSIGAQFGVKPFAPTVDISRNIGMGQLLGFNPMKLTGLYPSHDKDRAGMQLREITSAAGAIFGHPASFFNAAASNGDMASLKKWELFMPRFLGNISHAFRYATQGKEVNAAGNAVIKFDPNDTEQMAEIVARAMGFQPRRLTEEYERIAAVKDAALYWDIRREVLLRQFGDTVKNKSPEERKAVIEGIRNYNQGLPKEAGLKVITSQTLKESVQNRLKVQQKQEAGIPTERANIPIAKEVEKYYPRGWPKGQVGAKPVK